MTGAGVRACPFSIKKFDDPVKKWLSVKNYITLP
jgi:hypothetical protein